MALEFLGASRALSMQALATVAQSLSVKAPEIWAILSVETSGCGFQSDRRPTILFERHIFHRLTGGKYDDGDISSCTPGGYGPSGAHQYDRLGRAVAQDRTAALLSTSWGLGQVMGENYKAAGFASVEAMVSAMCDSEDAQLTAMAAFLKCSHLHLALQAHDWTSFAAGYNGPTYAKNQYDGRLRGEYQKFAFGVLPDLQIRSTQLYLTFGGFHPGGVDGIWGRRTESALLNFQQQHGLEPNGQVCESLIDSLTSTYCTCSTVV